MAIYNIYCTADNSIDGGFFISRFDSEFKRLANENYPDNILIVTHGFGVSQAVSMSMGVIYGLDSVWVDYCGHVKLSRTGKESSDWTLEELSKEVHIDEGYLKVKAKPK